tara:strand:+ start:625 stop:840 length:216 start_codon:yes stop_codon:yes gene_type:complete
MKYNKLLQYQDKVFDKFLDSLFPLSVNEKDKKEKLRPELPPIPWGKNIKDSEPNNKPIQSGDSEEEAPLFI